MNRADEEAKYLSEESSDYNILLGRYAKGEYGLFGDWAEPGLVPRLKQAGEFWDKRRMLKETQVSSNGYLSTLTMSDEQIKSLQKYVQHELDNYVLQKDRLIQNRHQDTDDEEEENRDSSWLADRLREFSLQQIFFQDLKKACASALKKSQDTRLEDAKRAAAAAAARRKQL